MRTIKIQGEFTCRFLYPEGPDKSIESRKYEVSLKSKHSNDVFYSIHIPMKFIWRKCIFPATHNMSKELKEFKIIHFSRRKLSFMYQNHLGDEDEISIVLNISQQVFGGPFQFTTKLKPHKCQLWTDFSCVSIRSQSNLYWSSSPKVEFNLSFFQVRKNMSYSKFYKSNYRSPGIGIINVMNTGVKLISWSRCIWNGKP